MTDLYTKQGRRYVPTTLAQQEAWGWQHLMVVAAFRYSLGRMTYISGVCAGWIIARWPDFPPSVQQLIQRELEEAFKRDNEDRAMGEKYRTLGWDCDRKEWEKVRALWASSPPFTPTAPSLDEIRRRAEWLAKEMEAVGEVMHQSQGDGWGQFQQDLGLDLRDLADAVLDGIKQPTKETQ